MGIWQLVLEITIMGRSVSPAVVIAVLLALLSSLGAIGIGVIFKRRIDMIAPPLEDDLDAEDD